MARCGLGEFPFSRQQPTEVGSQQADHQTDRPPDGGSQFPELRRGRPVNKNAPAPQQAHENCQGEEGASLRLPEIGPAPILME